MPIRHYRNSVPAVVLTSEAEDSDTTLEVGSTAGFPPVPFYLTLARQTVTEEIVLCTEVTDGTHFEVVRAQDGSDAEEHDPGTLVEHTSTALDYREAGIVRLDDTEEGALQGDSVDDWMGRVIFNTDTRELKVSNGANLMVPLMPIGLLSPYAGASAPVGWLLCQGQSVAIADYPELHAVIGTTYGDPGGGNFNLPDLRQKFPMGVAASGVGNALGATGGSIDHVHTGPSHTHSNGTYVSDSGGSHTHDLGNSGSAGSHTHTNNHTHFVSGDTSDAGSHGHSFSDSFTTGGPSSTSTGREVGTINTTSNTHTHSGSVSGTTGSGGTHDHNFTRTTENASSAVQSGGSHSHDLGNAVSGGAHTHNVSGTSSSGGTGNTGTANPPFLALNFIIFAGVTGG